MHSAPRRESRGLGAQPLVGLGGEARIAIENRFITKLILARRSGFALGRGSLLGSRYSPFRSVLNELYKVGLRDTSYLMYVIAGIKLQM